MTRRVELLDEHNVRRFRSGVPALDAYLRGPARGNNLRGIGRTHLLLRGEDDPADWPEILGFFTLSMGELPVEVARRLTGETLPGYPMPVALIGRLANDERVRGAGLGGELLGEALRVVLEASNLIACLGIMVAPSRLQVEPLWLALQPASGARSPRSIQIHLRQAGTTDGPDCCAILGST